MFNEGIEGRYPVVAKVTRKENYCTRRFGRYHFVCLQDNSHPRAAEFAHGGIFIMSAIIGGRIVDKRSLINIR